MYSKFFIITCVSYLRSLLLSFICTVCSEIKLYVSAQERGNGNGRLEKACKGEIIRSVRERRGKREGEKKRLPFS